MIQVDFESHLAPWPLSRIELKLGRLRFGESHCGPHRISNSPIPGMVFEYNGALTF
jgi:hypothetical protein